MPTEALGAPRLTLKLPRLTYDHVVNASFWLFMVGGAISLVEPSPYDFLAFIAIPIWFCGGFKIHRFILPFFGLVFSFGLAGWIALLPYLDEPDPTKYILQEFYLLVTVVFFALFFAEKSLERGEVCLRGYALGTVIAAAAGVVGYFNIAGTGALFTMYDGRASGTFKDPNVLGSYIVPGAIYFMQSLLLGRTRWPLLTLVLLMIDVAGVFLSFSRGSWGAFLIASTLMVGFTFMTNSDARLRRRMILMLIAAGALAAIGLVVLLSIDATREMFLQRASGLQDYDQGETGRFGNQMHSLPMLIDRFFGFGPLRFRLTFDLDPHNSYINSFASYGWMGGFSFFLLVGLTAYIGFRLCLVRSPYRRLAHVFWPSLFVFLFQGLQIDIDHWRQIYIMLGAVWGLETARMRWLEQGRPNLRPNGVVEPARRFA